MIAQVNFIFAENISSAYTGDSFFNTKSDVMSIEFSGTFTSGVFTIEGKTNANSTTYTPIGAINVSTFDVILNGAVTKPGIYEIDISGIREIRVRVTSVTGGSVTILGRAVNSAS